MYFKLSFFFFCWPLFLMDIEIEIGPWQKPNKFLSNWNLNDIVSYGFMELQKVTEIEKGSVIIEVYVQKKGNSFSIQKTIPWYIETSPLVEWKPLHLKWISDSSSWPWTTSSSRRSGVRTRSSWTGRTRTCTRWRCPTGSSGSLPTAGSPTRSGWPSRPAARWTSGSSRSTLSRVPCSSGASATTPATSFTRLESFFDAYSCRWAFIITSFNF